MTKAASSSLTLTLTPSATTVTYGNEGTVTYGVSFGSAGPAPTGTVTVAAGATTLCTVTLVNGAGSCAITPATALGVAGSPYSVAATYGGDANYSGSVSSTASHPDRDQGHHHHRLRAVPERGRLRGRERGDRAAPPSPPSSRGVATGTVTIADGVALCPITLTLTSNNTGSCSLTPTALPVPGSPYSITADLRR